jgi:hypothetical protein
VQGRSMSAHSPSGLGHNIRPKCMRNPWNVKNALDERFKDKSRRLVRLLHERDLHNGCHNDQVRLYSVQSIALYGSPSCS